MKKIFTPASFLLFILVPLTFFLAGMFFAGISGIADKDGLAGGAVILMYGVTFSVSALILAVLLSYFASHKSVVFTNRILAIIFVILAAAIMIRYFEKTKNKSTSIITCQSVNTT